MRESLQIEKLVYGGEGLSRVEGEVILTPFVLPGEIIEAERIESRHHVGRARLLRIAEESPDRVAPPCAVFGTCGGCQYEHAAYSAQLRIKRDILAETLRRAAKIEIDPAAIAIESGPPYGYRNRVQLHFENNRGGFREMHSNRFVPVGDCPIAAPKINEALAALSRMARDPRWPTFLRSLEIFTDDVQVQWNVLETERPLAKQFFEWLAEEVPGSVAGPLDYWVGADLFRVGGNSFFQTNRFMLPRLASLAVGDARGLTAWDLYAGVGFFSLPLAARFERVVAVESGRGASADLKHNSERAELPVEVVTEQTETFLRDHETAPDLVLADPPRAGLGKAIVSRLLELCPAALTVVSCDPATLARDLAALTTVYSIGRVTLVDLFPQTFHIETIVSLVLR